MGDHVDDCVSHSEGTVTYGPLPGRGDRGCGELGLMIDRVSLERDGWDYMTHAATLTELQRVKAAKFETRPPFNHLTPETPP